MTHTLQRNKYEILDFLSELFKPQDNGAPSLKGILKTDNLGTILYTVKIYLKNESTVKIFLKITEIINCQTA